MPNFNVWDKRGKGGGGGFKKPGFGDRSGGRDFRGGDSFDKPKFPATCVECGERCQVPFKPMNGKPVYCNNCFRKDERPVGDRHFQNDRGGRDDRFPKRENRFEGAPSRPQGNGMDMDQLNRKLDTIIELLKGNKPMAKEAFAPVAAKKPVVEAKAETVVAAKEDKKASKKKAEKAPAAKADKKKKK